MPRRPTVDGSNVGLTVAELLAEREFGLELIAGSESSLKRQIAGIQVVEVEAPSRWLAKDWVMLTTGIRLHSDRRAQRRLIEELHGSSIAALGYGLSDDEAFPPGIRVAAQALDFPVFRLPYELSFRELTTFVSRCLLSRELRLQQRLSALQRSLLDAFAGDRPQQKIVERLAEYLNSGVVVLQADGPTQLVAGNPPSESLLSELATRARATVEFECDRWQAVATPIESDQPLVSRWLAAASNRSSFSLPLARQGVQVAAPLLAASVRLDEAAQRQELAIRSALLEELLTATGGESAYTLAARSASFGITLKQPVRVAVFRVGASEDSEVRSAWEVTSRTFAEASVPFLVSDRSHGFVLLAQASEAELLSVVERCAQRIQTLVAGIGRAVTSIAEVPESFRDAELALSRVGDGQEKRVLGFEDFDLPTLLLCESSPGRLQLKVNEIIDPIRAHPILYETLVAYFELDFDVSRTAHALHLHENTVRYRLARLEELLGAPLRRPGTIAALYTALLAAAR